MTCIDIIKHLKQHNVAPIFSDGQLKLTGDTTNLPPDLLRCAKEKKNELILFLNRASSELKFEPLQQVKKQNHYIASNAQKRFWILHQFRGAAGTCNIAKGFMLKGALDYSVLEKSFQLIIGKYESLRTNFLEVDGELRQGISDERDFKIEIESIEGLTNPQEILFGEMTKATGEEFDLAANLLIKVRLYRLSDQQHAMLLTMHHIVSDGWSIGVLMSELLHTYHMCLHQQDYYLLPLQIQYKEYAYWLDKRIRSGHLSESSLFWKNQFGNVPEVLDLPVDFTRPDNRDFKGCFLRSYLEQSLHTQIIKYCSSRGITPFIFFYATLTLLLSKLSGQLDVVIGVPVSGRNHVDLESQIGLFVNTLPLRTRINSGDSVSDLIIRISKSSREALAHQDYPFDQLIEDLGLVYSSNRNPLFDVMMVFHDTVSKFEDIRKNNVEFELLDTFFQNDTTYLHGNRPVKFDLVFNFSDDFDGRFCQEIEYSSALFKRSTIEKIDLAYKYLISQVVDEPSKSLRDIEIVLPEEKQKILDVFNNTTCEYPKDKTVIGLIEEQVEKTPDNIAIVCGQREFTYQELNQMVNRFAHYLRLKYSVQRDDLICIKLHRSEWMIVAILAALKSGGAYVPIDPQYPSERVEYMVKNSRCRVLIDEDEVEKFRKAEKNYDDRNVPGINQAEDLIYVIYTSGSTGLPKGSMVKQHSFVNLTLWYQRLLALDPKDTVLLMAPISFDLAQKNIFAALITGARLCLSQSLYADYEELAETIFNNQVTVVNAAPSAFYPLLDVGVNQSFMRLASLKNVVLGGEPISIKEFLPWADSNYYNARVINGYGPTECTSVAACYVVDNQQLRTMKNIPIGRPIDNTSLYILDGTKALAPVGTSGEIFISGVGVGRGYLYREDLTSEKFLHDPFRPGKMMYATGDWGHWLPDGNIEFLGRKDNQLKIRGFRIEAGEIESALLAHPTIASAVVIGRKNVNQEAELVAYVVCKALLETIGLRVFLRSKLPSYMVPSHFVQMESFPLTPSGKIDRKALPDPAIDDRFSATPLGAPMNDTEAQLLSIWKKVLRRENFGVHDNFFDLGGNSLSIMKMVGMVNGTLGRKITGVTAFQFPNIASLAKHITEGEKFSTTDDDTTSVHILQETLNLINQDIDEK